MPRSAGQSDFSVTREPEPPPLPEAAQTIELPRAVLRSTEATARATRLVLWFTLLVLAALVLLTAIGPHIPSGE